MHSNYRHLGRAVVQLHELAFLYNANRAGLKWQLVIEFAPDGFAYHSFR
jgi:hypothetical protein